MSIEEEEDLRKVPVQIATCAKCNGTILVSVKEGMSRQTSREFAKMMEAGCNVSLTNVVVARTNKWCDEPCEGMFGRRKKKKDS